MTKKVFAIIGVVLASLIFVACLAVDIWYAYIYFFAPQKYVNKTYELGMQTTADGSNSKNLIEIKYFSNKNKNGLECFEFKLNYLLDENKSALYSQGYQFCVDNSLTDNYLDISNSFGFGYDLDNAERVNYETKWFNNGLVSRYYTYASSFVPIGKYFTKYEYASADNYKNTIIDSNKINDSTGFKIQVGEGDNEEVYFMKLKGLNTPFDDNSLYASNTSDNKFWIFNFGSDYKFYYTYFNMNYLMNVLFNSIQSIKTGSTETIVFQLTDLFDYFKYDKESGVYSSDKVDETVKIEEYISNYFAIAVTVSDNGLQRAEDSIFNCVYGTQTFNLKVDNYTTDYLTGKAPYTCTLKNFELVDNGTDIYDIKLSENFLNKFSDYKESMLLNIDLDYTTTFEIVGLKVNAPTTESYCGFKINFERVKRTIISGGGMIV